MKSLNLSFILVFSTLGFGQTPASAESNKQRAVFSGEIEPEALIEQSCQTGTLIFSQGDCLAVRIYTNSPYTHVAIVVEQGGQKLVYDSMNGVGVRKQSLSDYLEVQCPDRVHLFQPQRSLNPSEASSLQSYLESQLGRPYAVSHHVTGKRCEGLHCSEYVTDALIEVDWLKAKQPSRVSPATLAKGIELHGVYAAAITVEIPFKAEPIPEPTSFCGKMWLDTKICVGDSCGKMSRIFLCR